MPPFKYSEYTDFANVVKQSLLAFRKTNDSLLRSIVPSSSEAFLTAEASAKVVAKEDRSFVLSFYRSFVPDQLLPKPQPVICHLQICNPDNPKCCFH